VEIIFFPVVSSFFLFFTRLISAVAEWMSTILRHSVALVHIWNAGLKCAGNAGRKNKAKNRHLRTIAQLSSAESSQLRHVSTIGKKLVKQQYLLHMSPQYGELWPTSG